MSNLYKCILFIVFTLVQLTNNFAQITYYYGVYNEYDEELKVCKNDTLCNLEAADVRMKALGHIKVFGDSLQINEQLKGISALEKKGLLKHISIIEYEDCDGVKYLDPTLLKFEYLATLIINKCNELELENIVRFINQINENENFDTVKDFKKAFKSRPGIYYLNSLVFKNQKLTSIGPPPDNLRPFNYLEEFRIESADITGASQQFVNDVVNEWIIIDPSRYLYSKFPNLKFLGFTDCDLDSIPTKLQYKQELVSLDLSGNNLTEIPECLINFKRPKTILSLNLSDNEISALSKPFLNKFVKRIDKDPKFAKYLFLSNNCLPKEELLKLEDPTYKGSINTLTFECNPIKYEGLHPTGSLLKLAQQLDAHHIALFMSGAQRSEKDHHPDSKLFIECTKECKPDDLVKNKKDNSFDPNNQSSN